MPFLIRVVSWSAFVVVVVSVGQLSAAFAGSPVSSFAAGSRIAIELEDLSTVEKITLQTMSVITGLMFLVLGTCVGSFLNVVVYRWPRGLSLNHPPSRCPRCETLIESRDNLPVIGWLLLRGRCRACQGSISIRYPLVESIVGLLFVGLLMVELLSGGKNLPLRPPNLYAGVVWILWYTKWDLVAIYAFHLSLLVGLLTLTESFRDDFPPKWFPVRRSLPMGCAFGGLVALAFLPDLHLVPVAAWPESWGKPPEFLARWPQNWQSTWIWTPGPNWRGPMTGMAGAVVGALLGLVLQFGAGWLGRSAVDARTWRTTLPLIGIYLGWQTVVAVAAVAMGITGLLSLCATKSWRQRILSTDIALIVACTGICLWKNWFSQIPISGFSSSSMFHSFIS